MTVLDFLFDSFFQPIRWVVSKSELDNSIFTFSVFTFSIFTFSLTVYNTKSSVFSPSFSAIACNNRQLRRKYRSYLSTISSNFSVYIYFKLLQVFNWRSPLMWLSAVSSYIERTYFISLQFFSYNYHWVSISII